MENEEKYVRTQEDEDSLESIKIILSEYYSESEWDYLESTETFSFPVGLILFEKGEWIISPTLTMVTEPFDIFILMSLVKDMYEEGIFVEIDHGSHLLFDEEGKYVDCISQGEIYKYAYENKVEEEEAFRILSEVEKTKNKIEGMVH